MEQAGAEKQPAWSLAMGPQRTTTKGAHHKSYASLLHLEPSVASSSLSLQPI